MTRTVEFLDDALEEAQAAAAWYFARSPVAAEGFADELDAAVVAIAESPDAWPPFDLGTRRYLLRRFPFSVVYRAEDHRIVIVAIAHARRRPRYWRRRIDRPA